MRIIFLILVFQVEVIATNPTENLGSIGGMAITIEEVQREMRAHRAEVFNYITHQSPSNGSGDFWNTKRSNGVLPMVVLRDTAIYFLTLIKVQEKLLKERELWPYKNYQEFLEDMEQTNDRRKKAIEDKQVLYGPVAYTEQTFFDYRFSNALIQLKRKLVEEKLITVTDDDMRKQFEKMQKTVYQEEKYTLQEYARQIREAYIEVAYHDFIAQRIKNVKHTIDQTELNKIALRN
jgi:hypothetical protein